MRLKKKQKPPNKRKKIRKCCSRNRFSRSGKQESKKSWNLQRKKKKREKKRKKFTKEKKRKTRKIILKMAKECRLRNKNHIEDMKNKDKNTPKKKIMKRRRKK